MGNEILDLLRKLAAKREVFIQHGPQSVITEKCNNLIKQFLILVGIADKYAVIMHHGH